MRGIVRAHGGVLQTHEVPGMSGSAFVLEVPIGGGAGTVPATAAADAPGSELALPEQASHQSGGRRRARRSSVDAFLESEVAGESEPAATETGGAAPTGRRRRRTADEQNPGEAMVPAQGSAVEGPGDGGGSGGTGRRRGRPSPAEDAGDGTTGDMTGEATGDGTGGVSEGAVVMAGEHAAGTAAVGTGLGGTVPPQGVPVPAGRRALRDGEQHALPAALPAAPSAPVAPDAQGTQDAGGSADAGQPTGRRRRALAAAAERAAAAQETGARTVFALPPAEADQSPEYVQAQAQAQAQVQAQARAQLQQADDGRHDVMLHDPADDHTPPQPHPVSNPTGRRRARLAPGQPDTAGTTGTPAQGVPAQAVPAQGVPAQVVPAQGVPAQAPQPPAAAQATPAPAQALPPQPWPNANTNDTSGAGTPAPAQPVAPAQPAPSAPAAAQPTPAPGTPLPLSSRRSRASLSRCPPRPPPRSTPTRRRAVP